MAVTHVHIHGKTSDRSGAPAQLRVPIGLGGKRKKKRDAKDYGTPGMHKGQHKQAEPYKPPGHSPGQGTRGVAAMHHMALHQKHLRIAKAAHANGEPDKAKHHHEVARLHLKSARAYGGG